MKSITLLSIIGLAGSVANADIAYGIDDAGHNQSQLIVWDTSDGSVTSLKNGLYKGYDFEASDVNAQNQWFIIGGGGGSVSDQVFHASTLDGTLTSIGTLSFTQKTSNKREVVGASFNDQSDRLWISRENDGFYSFSTNDLTTLQKEFTVKGNIEAMAWDNTGSTLYYMNQKSLYSWNKTDGKTLLKKKLFAKGVESLEFDSSGNLLAGVGSGSSKFSLMNIDLDTYELSTLGQYGSPSGDLESLAFSPGTIIPAPGALVILSAGSLIGLRRRRR